LNNCFLSQFIQRQEGSMMVVVLMVMAVLSIMGLYAVSLSTTEQQISTHLHTQKQAFYNADAGIRFTVACLKKALEAENDVLPHDASTPVSYCFPSPPPDDFAFGTGTRIRLIDRAGPEIYEFSITGTAGNALGVIKSEITARFIRPKPKSLGYAAFGDALVAIKNRGHVQSYDSESADPIHRKPGAAGFEPTHAAHIGSNGNTTTKKNAHIDGNADLGENSLGDPAVDNIHKKTDIYGSRGKAVGRIDPDPLGIDAGGTYDPTTYTGANDNATHMTHVDGKGAPRPVGTSISTDNGDSITLEGKPGGSNFYFTSVELNPGAELRIDTTEGPVNIFIDGGGFDAKSGSIANTGKKAADFAIYANYESTDGRPAIEFHHDADLRGTVYAPKANILVNNSGCVYGLLWGRRVDIRNSGDLYYDQALAGKYAIASNDLALIAWEQKN